MRLLLIEDDRKIALFVKTGLKEAGFIVDHADNGPDGQHHALTESYAAAIIDLMLPGIDGLSIIMRYIGSKEGGGLSFALTPAIMSLIAIG